MSRDVKKGCLGLKVFAPDTMLHLLFERKYQVSIHRNDQLRCYKKVGELEVELTCLIVRATAKIGMVESIQSRATIRCAIT